MLRTVKTFLTEATSSSQLTLILVRSNQSVFLSLVCSSSAVKVKAVNLEKLFALQVFRTGKVFAGDCYGENLWELGGELSEQVYDAWNTYIKLTLQVHRTTNTYFEDMLLGCGISQASEIFIVRKQ